jgi:hypothetical protein
VRDYLQRGEDPNTRIADGKGNLLLPLDVALYPRREDIALLLLEAGADFDEATANLRLVASQGMDRALALLFTQAPERLERSARAVQGEEDYVLVVTTGYYQSLDAVFAASARTDISWDATRLSNVAASTMGLRLYELTRRLLSVGAEPTDTVMVSAAQNGSAGLMRELLRRGGNPLATPEQVVPGDSASSAMDRAWRRYRENSGHERETARLILFELQQAGAELPGERLPAGVARDGFAELVAIDEPSERLVEAARLGFYETVEELLGSGQRLEREALIEATSSALVLRQNDIALLLIDSRGTLDNSVLNAAARGNSPGIVRRLLSLGLDPNASTDGKTAIEAWWERSRRQGFLVSGEYVLHELIAGGGDACWLVEHAKELNTPQSLFLHDTAPECWPADDGLQQETQWRTEN